MPRREGPLRSHGPSDPPARPSPPYRRPKWEDAAGPGGWRPGGGGGAQGRRAGLCSILLPGGCGAGRAAPVRRRGLDTRTAASSASSSLCRRRRRFRGRSRHLSPRPAPTTAARGGQNCGGGGGAALPGPQPQRGRSHRTVPGVEARGAARRAELGSSPPAETLHVIPLFSPVLLPSRPAVLAAALSEGLRDAFKNQPKKKRAVRYEITATAQHRSPQCHSPTVPERLQGW